MDDLRKRIAEIIEPFATRSHADVWERMRQDAFERADKIIGMVAQHIEQERAAFEPAPNCKTPRACAYHGLCISAENNWPACRDKR